jgi:hypothetical protein
MLWSSTSAGLGEPVAVLQEQSQVGLAGCLGGRVGLAEDGVEGALAPARSPSAWAHAGGQQQRRRARPGGPPPPARPARWACGRSSEAAWESRLVVGGPAELLQGGRLQLVEAVLDGQLQGSLLVGEGGLVAAEGDQDPAPVEAGAGLQAPGRRPRAAAPTARSSSRSASRLAYDPGGVGGRRHPVGGRGRPVAGGGGVAGGRLGPVGQHAGQATVAGDPGGPRAGLVEDLADQVVASS